MRPRWHDLVIVAAMVAILMVGVWALWGDDIRTALRPPAPAAAPAAGSGQT
ncbi:MAG: hypothetical protein AB7P03_25585 [Kofleriaceae bacterium]